MDADAIIIGAGACGLMCAVQAGYLGKRVVLLEKGTQAGAKILISGGGRCNYTNLSVQTEQFITTNPHFLKSAFSQWTVEDTISFFEVNGIEGEEKTLGQLFPAAHNAKDIVRLFKNLCHDFGQEIRCDAEVTDIQIVAGGYQVSYQQKDKVKTISASKLVIATGGLPIPKMGATDFALRYARKLGLNIETTAPALVPLTITGKDEEWFAGLSGNAVFAQVSNDNAVFEENILFTHWGLSGPAILQISSYWKPGELININLLPKDDITARIQAERLTHGKTLLSTLMHRHFTRKFTDAMGKYLPLNQPVAALTKTEIENIHQRIHEFKVKPAGDKGYDKAEVMRGGISTSELSSKSLECKKYPGLYFGGECLDITGWLGGYNFQWAWASGYVIAQQL